MFNNIMASWLAARTIALLTRRKTMQYLDAAALIAVCLVACGDSDPVAKDQQTEEGDRAQLAELRREMDALVGDAAGASIDDCRYLGLGAKPCGGPWEYDDLLGLVNRFNGTNRAADSV